MIDGAKKFITGADGSDFLIVTARTSGEPGDSGGATMFLVPTNAPGIRIAGHVGTVDRSTPGGHAELTFARVFVPEADLLGDLDEGYRYSQIRLGPARMTHVMRWTGAARRAHEAAVHYVAVRSAFGARLSEQGMVQQMIADNEIDLAAARALLLEAYRQLDAGERASKATSITKTFAAEALHRVVDRSMQMPGGACVSRDLPIAKVARELRPFPIYDGPSEVHRWSIARRTVREAVRSSTSSDQS